MNSTQALEHNVHLIYRPDIDGLRAIAILAVVIFHAFPTNMRGGFVGVDIFFVISGYLISSIIFRSLSKGDFSFSEFYARRIKRIFPALALVFTAAYAVGWFVLLPDEFEQLGKHVAAGAGYVQNLVLLKEAGYFDTASELKPLMHLWSLAIEEQFYLVYPLLIWGAWRLGINILTIVVVVGFLSFGANVFGIEKNIVKTFFMPHTRFWELLVGAVLAYLNVFKRVQFSAWLDRIVFHPVFFRYPPSPAQRESKLNNFLSILGGISISWAIFGIHEERAFPGWWALIPVAGAFLVILAGPQAWLNQKILARNPMVFIGLISYPLYLWHWPILSYAQIIVEGPLSPKIRIGAVILSFFLAWITYFFIEKPVRFGRKTWAKTAVLIIFMTLIGCVGFYTYKKDGFLFRTEAFAKISVAAGEWHYPGNLKGQESDGIEYFAQQTGASQTTLFVGDSNIEQYYPRMDELIKIAPESTNSIIFKTGGGCFPVPGMRYASSHKRCETLMSDVLELVKMKPEITTIVIGAEWNGYLSGGWGLTEKIERGSDSYQIALSNLSGFIRDMVGRKKKVFLILNIPRGVELDPKFMVRRKIENFPNIFEVRTGGIDREALDKHFGLIQADLARIGKEIGAQVIKPMDFLCDKRCDSLDARGEPIYKDDTHLRPTFVRKHVTFMDLTVKN